MPKWLQGLQDTSLLFWRDKIALTWEQAVALVPSTGAFYVLARQPFAGSESLIGTRLIPLVLEILTAFVLVSTAGRLGRIEYWGPKFVRLLAVHLNFVMAILAVNLVWRWAEFLPDLLLVALAANTFSSLLFGFYTYQRRRVSVRGTAKARRAERFPWVALVASALLVSLINTFMTRYSVLPMQAAEF